MFDHFPDFFNRLLKKDWENLRSLAAVIGAWVASFLISFFTVLPAIRSNEFFYSFWKDGFLPFPPLSSGDFIKYEKAFWHFIDYFLSDGRFSDVSKEPFVLLFAGLMIVGLWKLTLAKHPEVLMCGLPILLALLASFLKLYAFMDRLLLFLIPCAVLLMGYGVEYTICRWSRVSGPVRIFCITALLWFPLHNAVKALGHPNEREEIKPLLSELRRCYKTGDVIYVCFVAEPAFQFYAPRFNLDSHPIMVGRPLSSQQEEYIPEIESQLHRGSVWIVATRTANKDVDYISHSFNRDQHTRATIVRRSVNGSLVLVERR